jgi:fatty-acid desaturase
VWLWPFCCLQRPLLAAEPKTLSAAEATKAVRSMYAERWVGIIFHHVVALCVAPLSFSWHNVFIAELIRFITTAIGINLCYHRLLTHHGFR